MPRRAPGCVRRIPSTGWSARRAACHEGAPGGRVRACGVRICHTRTCRAASSIHVEARTMVRVRLRDHPRADRRPASPSKLPELVEPRPEFTPRRPDVGERSPLVPGERLRAEYDPHAIPEPVVAPRDGDHEPLTSVQGSPSGVPAGRCPPLRVGAGAGCPCPVSLRLRPARSSSRRAAEASRG